MKIYSEYSFWWLWVIAALSLFVSFIQYYYKNPASVFSKPTKIVLFALRSILLFVVGVLLLNFYSEFSKNEYVKPVLVVAVDNSQSMISAKDSADVKKFFSDKFKPITQSLEEKFDVQTITFGEKIAFNDSITFKEYKSNPEQIFNQISNTFNHRDIGAMLLITDGIFNEGIHPVSLANNINYPIYTIATGDTNIYKDVSIKKILCNKNVFIGNDFVAEILIQSSAVFNEPSKVTIYEGKKIIAEKEIQIQSNKNDLITLQFQLSAEKGGHHTYKVQVNPVKDEHNIQNNTAYFVVNVIENKTKILMLYSAPHPDISAIRQSLNTSPQYEIDVYQEQDFSKELSKYDVIIFHSPKVNSSVFQKCLKSNVPMFVISSQLQPLQNTFISIKQFSNAFNEIETHFNSSFSAYSTNPDYNEVAPHLPVIIAPYGDYSPLGESDILYFQKINNVLTNLPLFFVTQNTFGKYAVFMGDGLWRWKITNYQLKQNFDWFNHLITQTIRYLSVKRDKTPFKVNIPAHIQENELLHITAELYNETMQTTTEPDVFIALKNENNNEYKFVFNKSANNYFLNAGILPPGEYNYTAYTQYKTKNYSQTGKIHILPVSIEKNNLVAQHHLLKTLSSKTSGKFYLLKNAQKIIDDLKNNENIKTIVIQNNAYQYWIENKWWFIIIVILAIAEWSIRRWNGII